MVTESIILQPTRIPRFNGIKNPPQFFFTVNDAKHKQSAKVIEQLALTHAQNTAPGSSPLYVTFPNWDSVSRDISGNSVFIFDERLGNNCFSPLCWCQKTRRWHILDFHRLDILWGFAINMNLQEARIPSAVNQLRADFGKNFIKRLDEGKFPWGEAPAENSGERRKERRKKRRKSCVDPTEFNRLW